ncbi:ABC transporter substrate-binding protein [Caenimonas koreensis]|uniref:ABC transporter substrate-binding protein n=1 Tax=Caenimonas koreensis TaxID=367474 RepID=UPI003782E0D9
MRISFKLLIATLALAAGVSISARPLDAVTKSGKLIAATEGAFTPFNYVDKGKLTGFEVELTELVAKKMGLGLEWKTVGFDALLAGLGQDRWDVVIASHGITDERAKAVTFMAPHYCSGGMIVSKDGAIRTAKSLAGKTVAVQTGTTYLENVTRLGTAKEVKNFPSDADARSALAAGRVDAWVTDRFTVLETLKKNPGLNLQSGDLLFTERIAAAAAKGNTGLADAWNKALAATMADGSYAALSKKYFGEDVRCK